MTGCPEVGVGVLAVSAPDPGSPSCAPAVLGRDGGGDAGLMVSRAEPISRHLEAEWRSYNLILACERPIPPSSWPGGVGSEPDEPPEYMLPARLPVRDVMVERATLNNLLPAPKRLSAEKALDIVPTLLSETPATDGVGAFEAR